MECTMAKQYIGECCDGGTLSCQLCKLKNQLDNGGKLPACSVATLEQHYHNINSPESNSQSVRKCFAVLDLVPGVYSSQKTHFLLVLEIVHMYCVLSSDSSVWLPLFDQFIFPVQLFKTTGVRYLKYICVLKHLQPLAALVCMQRLIQGGILDGVQTRCPARVGVQASGVRGIRMGVC